MKVRSGFLVETVGACSCLRPQARRGRVEELLWPLISAYVVHFKSRRKLRVFRIAAAVAADGLIQDHVDGLVKRIEAVRSLVVGAAKVHGIHQRSIEVEMNKFSRPLHSPKVKLVRPGRIVKFGDWLKNRGPTRGTLRSFPRNVGVYVSGVIFHDVDFAVGRPAPGNPQRPPGRPDARPGINSAAHAEVAVLPAMDAARGEACGSVIRLGALSAPILAALAITGIRFFLPPGFDNQFSMSAGGILRLVPLELLVAHKAVFVSPVRGIGPAVGIEFVLPNEPIARRRLVRNVGGARKQPPCGCNSCGSEYPFQHAAAGDHDRASLQTSASHATVEQRSPHRHHPTLYFRISSALTSLLMPGASGPSTSPSIIFCGPPDSI